jgi:hypothetical protein
MLIISILSIRKLILISVLTQLPNVSNVALVNIRKILQSHLVFENLISHVYSHYHLIRVIKPAS